MGKLIDQLTIETAMNGYQVRLKDYHLNGTVRPVPYVFETMETLLKFIQTKLEETNEFNLR
jgi:hypothetical protein